MSDTVRFVIVIAVLVAIMGIAGSLLAQGYNRSETTGAYVERSGASIAQEPLNADSSMSRGNALLVPLPAAFRYFNRSYTSCWMATSGRVTFDAYSANKVGNPSSLAPPLALSNYFNTIFAIGGDLIAREDDLRQSLGAFVESDRVVLQWRNVTGFDSAHCEHLNFQVHLLTNGSLEMHYGPESSVPGYTSNFAWVSGVVNQSGSAAVAGLVNSLGQQMARPANGTIVTLTLMTIPTAGVTINQNLLPGRRWLTAPTANAPVLSFKLVASAAGGTVSTLEFDNPDFAADGNPVTLSLVRDTAPIGQYNGEATIGTAVTTGSTTDFTGLSESLSAGQAFDYLLLASFTSLAVVGQDNFGCYDGTGIDGGSAINSRIGFAPRGFARMAASPPTMRPAATAGSMRQRLMSFSIVQDVDSPVFAVSQMMFQLSLSGMVASDFSQLQLWRDRGNVGEWDNADVLLGSISTVATVNTFSALSENTTLAGTPYLVTADVSAAFTGMGDAYVTWLDSADGSLAYEDHVNDGDVLLVSGSNPLLVIRDVPDTRLRRIPAAISEANVHASTFEVSATSGTGSISALFFSEDNSSNSRIANPRLYLDNGTVSGRFDTGDTALAATTSLAAAGFTLTLTTPHVISTAAQYFVLIVDIAPTATSDMRFALDAAGVTTTFAIVVGAADGTHLEMRAGSANGVDVQFQMLGNTFDVQPGSLAALARVTCQARGSGGTVPIIQFAPVLTQAGRGIHSGIYLTFWIEGAGPLGVLDATDRECYYAFSLTTGFVQLQSGVVSLLPAGVTRDFLIVARHIGPSDLADVRGSFTLVLAGLYSGTDVALLPAGTPPQFPVITLNDNHGTPAGGSSGGSDESGCTTNESRGGLVFLGILGVLGCCALLGRALRQEVDGTCRA